MCVYIDRDLGIFERNLRCAASSPTSKTCSNLPKKKKKQAASSRIKNVSFSIIHLILLVIYIPNFVNWIRLINTSTLDIYISINVCIQRDKRGD